MAYLLILSLVLFSFLPAAQGPRVEQKWIDSVDPASAGPNFEEVKNKQKSKNSRIGRLDGFLSRLAEEGEGKGVERALEFAKGGRLTTRGTEVRIQMEADSSGLTPALKSLLASKGARVSGTYGQLLDVWVDPRNLRALSSLPGLKRAVREEEPVAHVIDGQEISLMKSAVANTNGCTGAGVKVAVIDLGFSTLATAQAAGEVPASAIVQDYTGTGATTGTVHGTAVAEIIYEMAPGAQLYLMKIATSVQLGNAKDYCKANGIKIVNHSVGWFNTDFNDGTGSICAIVNDAYNNGILWVNSAGNSGTSHYAGTFSGVSGGFHDFGGANVNQLGNYPAGASIYAYLCWNDTWGTSGNDYDLLLYFFNGASWVLTNWSAATQNGNDNPTEAISWVTPAAGNYGLAIAHWSGSTTRSFHLFASSTLQYNTPANSMTEPANGAKTFTVGALAVSNWTNGPVQSYSSRGPTTDGRTKPEVAGCDTQTNFTYGLFSGTSAASPSVAGAAAVILSANSGYSVQNLWAHLTNYASAAGLTGTANEFGFGKVLVAGPPGGSASLTDGGPWKSSLDLLISWNTNLKYPTPGSHFLLLTNKTTGASWTYTQTGTSNQYNFTGVDGETYQAKIVASNAFGTNIIASSPGVSIDTSPPTTPGQPIPVDVLNSGNLSFNWAPSQDPTSGVSSYTLVFSRDSNFSSTDLTVTGLSNTNASITTLTPGVLYYAKVLAKNGAGLSSAWSPVSMGAQYVAGSEDNFALYNNRLRSGSQNDPVRLVSKDAGRFRLSLYDPLGNLLKDFGEKEFRSGEVWEWDGRVNGKNLPTRLYFFRVVGPGVNRTLKFLVE